MCPPRRPLRDVDPAGLDPAPSRPRWGDGFDRVGLNPKPGVACGEPARFTRAVDFPGCGPRWLDKCRNHFLELTEADRRHLPAVPLAETLAVLRDAAWEAGVALAILTDDDVRP
ncbi:hypothetical protein [Streptomyces sp. 2A115]|uniref:hypothetical protein n=1 Tax=Streptomyces sp. 2A115 TaxID=3457439 RepID=UPI003FD09D66